MIRSTVTENKILTPIEAKRKGCWVSLIAPTEEEVLEASNVFDVDPEALRAALDPEERSRIETDEKYKKKIDEFFISKGNHCEKLYNYLIENN